MLSEIKCAPVNNSKTQSIIIVYMFETALYICSSTAALQIVRSNEV